MKPTFFLSFCRTAILATLSLVAAPGVWADQVQPYQFRVVASGLQRPTGIAVQGNHTIFFTEVPTPGVNGAHGGSNSVSQLNLFTGQVDILHMGEPEPVNI